MSSLDDFKAFLADLTPQASYIAWRRDNSGLSSAEKRITPLPAPKAGTEVALWDSFRDRLLAGQRPLIPTMGTARGREFVDASRLYLETLPPPTPPPAQSPDNTIVTAASGGQIVDAYGNVWTLRGGQVAVGGVIDAITSGVVELAYETGKVWQKNSSGLWWYKVRPADKWLPTGGTSVSPVPGDNPPPPPPPPPSGGFRVGVIGNIGGGGNKALMLGTGTRLIREDNGAAVQPWAQQNHIDVMAICYLDPNNVAIATAKLCEADNEPYAAANWSYPGHGGGDPAGWVRAARDWGRTMKQNHADKILGLPLGPCWSGGLINGVNAVTFYNQAAPDVWDFYDYVHVHSYAQPDPPSARVPILDSWRSALEKTSGKGKKFWATEFGYPVGGNNWNPGGQTPQQQADYLGQAVTLYKSRGDFAGMFVYQLQDWGPRDSDSEHWFGVYDQAGNPRPAAAVVKQLVVANP